MPGSEKPGADLITLTAAAALARYRAIQVDTTGKAAYCATTKIFAGTTQGPATIGQPVTVLTPQGVGLMEAGAAFVVGATLTCDATGRVIAGTGIGVALEASLAAGQIVSVLFGTSVVS